MSATFDVSITACDYLNLGFGYQVRITRSDNGSTVLFVSIDPDTGKDLLTLNDCLRVAAKYAQL